MPCFLPSLCPISVVDALKPDGAALIKVCEGAGLQEPIACSPEMYVLAKDFLMV